jgi:hypothetical protein
MRHHHFFLYFFFLCLSRITILSTASLQESSSLRGHIGEESMDFSIVNKFVQDHKHTAKMDMLRKVLSPTESIHFLGYSLAEHKINSGGISTAARRSQTGTFYTYYYHDYQCASDSMVMIDAYLYGTCLNYYSEQGDYRSFGSVPW